MQGLLEIVLSFSVVLILSLLLYFLGNRKKRETEDPFASGEKIPAMRIQYLAPWLFYVILFGVIDVAFLLIALTAGQFTPIILVYMIIVSLVFIVLKLK